MSFEERLPDQFSRDLLVGSLMVANDHNNPVRFHLAAAGLRELFGHILHADAPDDEVRACSWFKQEPNTNTVTRRQKAIYSTQGARTAWSVLRHGTRFDAPRDMAMETI